MELITLAVWILMGALAYKMAERRNRNNNNHSQNNRRILNGINYFSSMDTDGSFSLQDG